MNKKKTVGIVIFACLFLVYLIFANDIVLCFDKDSKVYVVDFDQFQGNQTAVVCLDSGEKIGGIFEKMYFEGWGFCDTSQDNKDKTITLIFKDENSNRCYAVDTKAQYRPDVYSAYKNSSHIYNAMNGIDCSFSTVKIKSGRYHFYVYVRENESDSGLFDMDMVFSKESDGLVVLSE